MKTLLIFLSTLIFTFNSGPNPRTPSNGDTIIILNKSANTAWQLDAETGQKITEYKTGVGPHEVAVSPDQERAIITNYGDNAPGNSLTIIDLNAREISKTISLGEFQRPHGVQWFSDGHRAIVTAESQQAVLIVDIDTGEILSAIDTNQQTSHMVALSSNEKMAFVTNLGSGSLSILDLAAGKTVQTIKTGAGTEGVAVIPQSNRVWITNRSANTVSIFDPEANTVIATLKSSSFPIRAKASPDGQLVAISNARSSEVSIFEVETQEQLHKLSTVSGNRQGMPIGLTFSDDRSHLYIANSKANHIAVISTKSWEIVNTFSTGTTPDGIAYISSKNN